MTNYSKIKTILASDWQSAQLSTLSQKISGVELDYSTWNAVSVLIIVDGHLFFIKRSEKVPHFKGHVAFIGGYKKSSDISPFATAQREFYEETASLLPLDFLGFLPMISTVASKGILPIVVRIEANLREFLAQVKTNGEWTIAFWYPLEKLNQENLWSHGIGSWQNSERYVLFHSLASSHMLSTTKEPNDELLWGATAKIVRVFTQMLASK